MKNGLGWIRDAHDPRDEKYGFVPRGTGDLSTLPQEVDWWKRIAAPIAPITGVVPDCYNQRQTSSCVGHAVARMVHLRSLIQVEQMAGVRSEMANLMAKVRKPAPMFLYANARIIEGSLDRDEGCMTRDAIKSLLLDGVCDEDLWPLDPACVCQRPTDNCYREAQQHLGLAYRRVRNTEPFDLLSAIAAGPLAGGVDVYTSFMDATNGEVPFPGGNETLEGGHDLCWTGYSIPRQKLYFDNSWGQWGRNGRGEVDVRYVTTLGSDFWLLTQMESNQ